MSRQLLTLIQQFAIGADPEPPGPEPTYLTLNSGVKVTIDANSIWSDQMGIAGIDFLPPLVTLKSTTSVGMANTSIAGQQWYQMAANITDINAAFNATKTNVLICGETRNTAANGKNFDQIIAEIHSYLDAATAAKAWDYIVMMGCFHSDGVPTAAAMNVTMKQVDDYVAGHLDEFKAASFCNYRDLSPFFQDGTSRAGFMTSRTTCLENFPGPYVHPDGSARELIAFRMSQALQKIPVERTVASLS